jgi:hypothetical protein
MLLHVAIALVLSSIPTHVAVAQAAPRAIAPDSGCGCAEQLTALVDKVEHDYVAFAMEVKGGKRADYDRMKARTFVDARKAKGDACLPLLRRYTYWFKDGHLFLSDVFGTIDTTARTPNHTHLAMDEAMVRATLERRGNSLDPIEGIWSSSSGYRVGVVRDSTRAGRFIAVMLTDTVAGWRPGDLKAEFVRSPDGTYATTIYSREHVALHPSVYMPDGDGARIYRGVLLHMAPFTWAKEFPEVPGDAARLASADPRAPLLFTSSADSGVIVLSMASFSFEHRKLLDSLLAANDARIRAARIFIIDVRDNEGGSGAMPDPLKTYLGKRDSTRHGGKTWRGSPQVLSSADNIKYFTQMMSQGWIPKHLVERMTGHEGSIVPFSDPKDSSAAAKPSEPDPDDTATVKPGPRHVAILADRGVVSAGPAFLLWARQYDHVTVFGENSGAMIDYQNVNVVRFGCPSAGLFLGYPTLAASEKLPADGINSTGVIPDVRIPPNDQPYRAIMEYYRTHQDTP